MRMGAPLDQHFESPERWIETLRAKGYTAAYAPVDTTSDAATRSAYRASAEREDITIAEVGAWSNPLDPDPEKSEAAIEKCIASLQLADDLGALCCVNIAGSCCPDRWDGPHRANFAPETFDRIVSITRRIIDAVEPTHTYYALETMPWIFPSTPEEYLKLIEAIDRPRFGVHLDTVNMIITPALAFDTPRFINHCIDVLGPHIKSCHAKDIALSTGLTVHLSECPPGHGLFDFEALFKGLDRIDPQIPIMLEHLDSELAYDEAHLYLRQLSARAEPIGSGAAVKST